MRVWHLTAGTGSFYCGTCIRDNALVRALRGLGHEAELQPLYLPIVSEGDSCSAGVPIAMSGINVYLQHALPLFRHTPGWLDSLFETRPVLSLAGRFAGATRPEELGALTVDMLEGRGGHLGKEIDRLLATLERKPAPDVIVLSNSLLVGLVAPLQARLGVPVVCTLQGEAAFVDQLGPEYSARAWSLVGEGLAVADGRVAVSRFAAERIAGRTGLDPADVDVVHNGIDTTGYLEHAPAAPPVLGFLARMYEAKGISLLARAFVELRGRGLDLRLRLGGTLNRGDEPDLVVARELLAGVAEHVEVRPNLSLEAKHDFLHDLTLFCVPALKDETSGLYNLEAMAAGVPVLAPRQGALPEMLEATGAITWFEQDDPVALADAIEQLLGDAQGRAVLSARGKAAVGERFTERHMALGMREVLSRVVERVRAAG